MARLSILGSIVRIAPSDYLKIRLKIVGVLFFLAMIGNGIILIATCEEDNGINHWHTVRKPPRCKLEHSVPIYRIVSKCTKFDQMQWMDAKSGLKPEYLPMSS